VSAQPRVGIIIYHAHAWDDMLEYVLQVEAAGFERVFLGDTLVHPFTEEAWFDAWSVLPALAQATQRIRVGTLVTSIVNRNPAMLAQQAVTVNHISGGRLDLGIGSGGHPSCHSMTGTPMWPLRERIDRLGEFVAIVDEMLRGEVTSYQGTHYQIQEARLPRPIELPRPRLWIAAERPRALRIAAKHADAWVFTDSEYKPGAVRKLDEIRALNERLDELASEAGRDPASIERWMLSGYSERTAFRSIHELHDLMGEFGALGIKNFVFTYQPDGPSEIVLPSKYKPAYHQFLHHPDRLQELAEALKLSS